MTGNGHSLLNGQIWETEMFHRAITQWLNDDQWILLGVPDQATHGGTCMCAHVDGDGKMFYTGKELEHRLQTKGWRLSPSKEVRLSV